MRNNTNTLQHQSSQRQQMKESTSQSPISQRSRLNEKTNVMNNLHQQLLSGEMQVLNLNLNPQNNPK